MVKNRTIVVIETQRTTDFRLIIEVYKLEDDNLYHRKVLASEGVSYHAKASSAENKQAEFQG